MSWAAGLDPRPVRLPQFVAALQELLGSGRAVRCLWEVRMLHPPRSTADVADLDAGVELFIAAHS